MNINERRPRVNFSVIRMHGLSWHLRALHFKFNMYEDRCCRETFCPVKGGLNRSTCSRNISWWTAGPGRVAPDVSSQLTQCVFFLLAAHHHLTDYHQNQTHCYSCCIRIPSVASLAIDLLVLLAISYGLRR